MWDTIAIIVLLGGLEYILWSISARHDKRMEAEDRATQARQIEILDGILTELGILNSNDENPMERGQEHDFNQKQDSQQGLADT